MSENLIAYMTWDRLVAWKILSLKISEDKDRLIPLGFGSRQRIFSKYGIAGNTIWVFSIPTVKIAGTRGSYKYRPTLVAKIKIKDHIGCDNLNQLGRQSDEIKKNSVSCVIILVIL